MSRYRTDKILSTVLCSSAIGSAIVVGLIAVFLVLESLPALRAIGVWRFVSDPSWHPAPLSGEPSFNMWPIFLGTLAVSLGAIVLATPLGLGSALFCRYFATPKVGSSFRSLIGLLAGIPSVVYGFWGLVTLVPLINTIHPPGASLFAGILILALMILPTIALIADAAFEAIPPEYLTGAAALGYSRWTTIKNVIIPAARSGLLTSILLGMGRAVGETMALLMVCGNVVQIPNGLFKPIRTLTANIALEMAYAMDTHRSALFVSGLLLMLLVTFLVYSSEVFGRRYVYH